MILTVLTPVVAYFACITLMVLSYSTVRTARPMSRSPRV
jgi:hypothetical protein